MPFRTYPKKSTSQNSLFAAEAAKEAPSARIVAHVDGGSRGNPGHAGYGVFIEDETGHTIAELSQYLGIQTNNFAEYSGLLAALHYAQQHKHKAVEIVSDSELMVRQMNGQYKVKNEGLKSLYQEAISILRTLDWYTVRHVRREFNKDADRLANLAMDRKR